MARFNMMTLALMQQVSKSETLSESEKKQALRYYATRMYKQEEPDEEQKDKNSQIRSGRE